MWFSFVFILLGGHWSYISKLFFFNQTWKISATISLNILLPLSLSPLLMGCQFQGSKYSDFSLQELWHRNKKSSVRNATNLQMSPIAIGSFKGYLLFGLQCFLKGASWILTAVSQVWLAELILQLWVLVIWQLTLSVPWFSS